MYLIDSTYFTNDIAVPNLSELIGGNAAKLEHLINVKGRDLLQGALGYALFSELNAEITDGELNTDAADKWKNLIDGKEYTKDGKTVKFEGLRKTINGQKYSLLADFVFYYWLQDASVTLTDLGQGVASVKNANLVNPTETAVKVWNRFVKAYQSSYSEDGNISLLQFINDHPTDYPDPAFKWYSYKNTFGL